MNDRILTLRCHSGISGDMLLAGLAFFALAGAELAPGSQAADAWLGERCREILPELASALTLAPHAVSGIQGWQARVDLPVSHEHRHLPDIVAIIRHSGMCEVAKTGAIECFELLADCEARAHGIAAQDVHFHEVGALDSILDICLCCELFQRLGAPALIASPLPVADGEIACCHGLLPAPAPAVMWLLQGVPVRPFAGDAQAGELITPTGIALLRCLGATFGPWPSFRLTSSCLIYGTREFAGAANGLICGLGEPM